MTKESCKQLFDNLYHNKIILRKDTICFCEFLNCNFSNNTLTIQLKVIETVVKLKPRNKNWFEEAKTKEYIEIQYQNNETTKIENQSIGGIYSCRIWANYDIVKKVYDLKKQGLEEEIYNILW
ncbi:MAG: hypothetical protein JSR09_01175 [Bacteroidetes bacterium]|nr:hypothetical protein [Bacteroidota bacterium]